jgi:uncharacterized protein (DUF697 family)
MARLEDLKKRLRRSVTEIEKRTDLSDDQKVERITNLCCCLCAGAACQPLPFADFFVLTPVQAYAGTRIAAIRRVSIGEEGAAVVIKQIGSAVGLALIAQQLIIGAYKTFIPFLGAFTTIPLVYGATYGICAVMDAYFRSKARGITLSPDQMKQIWRDAKPKGVAEGKRRKDDIRHGRTEGRADEA